jgi:hypothetical protein
MSLLEQRLSVTEDRVSDVIAFTRQLAANQARGSPTPQQNQQTPQSSAPNNGRAAAASVPTSASALGPLFTRTVQTDRNLGTPGGANVITVQPTSPLVSASSTIHRINNISSSGGWTGDSESKQLLAEAMRLAQQTTDEGDDGSDGPIEIVGHFDSDEDDDVDDTTDRMVRTAHHIIDANNASSAAVATEYEYGNEEDDEDDEEDGAVNFTSNVGTTGGSEDGDSGDDYTAEYEPYNESDQE